MIVQRCVKAYIRQTKRIWCHLPAFVRRLAVGRAYGRHLHALVRRYAERNQNHSTFFLRNRTELELMIYLLDRKPRGANIDITVVACSKGAEVYSILWKVRSARPDITVRMRAVDISQEVVNFAEAGVYSLASVEASRISDPELTAGTSDITWKDQVLGNQPLSIFERMTERELQQMFELEGDQARVKPWLKEGITWLRGDATDPEFAAMLGLQDIVVANRFLCHMKPASAERCLRNLVRLVKPGGYIFVSGIDLDVRAKVARDLGWKPVKHLTREIHDGDFSLISGWPFEYWGLEPFCDDRSDWRIRFTPVFQIGETLS